MKLLLAASLFLSINLLKAQNDTSYIVPSFPEKIPYLIKQEDLNIVLPDSLGGEKYKGYIRLMLFIDSVGSINSFNILQINLKTENLKDSIAYYKYYPTPKSCRIYPQKIMPYFLFLSEWIKQVPVYSSKEVNTTTTNRLIVKCIIL
jgi:hypothetical protein